MRVVSPRTPRSSTILLGRIEAEGASFEVRVRNLSAGGVLVDRPPGLEAGQHVKFTSRPTGNVWGTVIRLSDRQCGIEFERKVELPFGFSSPDSGTSV